MLDKREITVRATLGCIEIFRAALRAEGHVRSPLLKELAIVDDIESFLVAQLAKERP